MSEMLSSAIENIRSNTDVAGLDEASIRQVVVLQILYALGWNQYDYDEVKPEAPVGDGRVDYSLQIEGRGKVFIEVKRGGENLSSHQEQLHLALKARSTDAMSYSMFSGTISQTSKSL